MTSWLASLRRDGASGVFAISLALALTACGGKKELVFTGVEDTGGNGPGHGGSGSMVSASCGDRVVDAKEECDDGARADGDGCDGSCTVEEGWTCTGEPSECVKCGNGTLEAGEDCDDGNNDKGDGCSAECKIEGSCETPLPITLAAGASGLTGMASSSTSLTDAGQVDAAACGAARSGGGADRIFEFVLPSAADVDITVGAAFDAIVRVTTSPCDLKSQLPNGCVDGAAVAGAENAHFDDMAAGTYYVVVDGKTPKAAGEFSVTVDASCPLSGLKIDRVVLADPFVTTILNTNQTCAVDLSRVGLYAQPEAADIPKTLPAISLEPLKRRVLTSASPPPAGTTYQGNIRFDLENYAGAMYLCRGACDTANGENVIDAFRWQGDNGALSVEAPTTVKFATDTPALADRTTMSYFRVLSDSVYPNFSGDDFVAAYWAETFDDGSLSGWDAPAALFYKPKFEKLAGTVGAFSLSLVGGNKDAGAWNGPTHVFKDNTGTDVLLNPTYVSLRVRAEDKTLSQGWAYFGQKVTQASGFGSFFREGGQLSFGQPMPVISLPYVIETWYLLEYKITYTGVGPNKVGTAEVFIDGKDKGALTITKAGINQVSLRNLGTTTAWYDQLVVR